MSTARIAPARATPPIPDQPGSITVEPCPLCDTTDAVSCPACNGRGVLYFLNDHVSP